MADPFGPTSLKRAAAQALDDTDPGTMSYDVPSGQPPPHAKAGLYASLAAMGLGQGLDAFSTAQALHAGGTHEANPIYGSDPSTGRILATKAAMAIPLALLAIHEHDKHPLIANLIGMAAGGAGALAAAHNYGVLAKQKGQ